METQYGSVALQSASKGHPQSLEQIDYLSTIEKQYLDDNDAELSNTLRLLKQQDPHSFLPRRWLYWIERVGSLEIKQPLEWQQDRAQLILKCFEDSQRLELLHKVYDNLHHFSTKKVLKPHEDTGLYFVIRELMRGYPYLVFQSHLQKQPAFLTSAREGAFDIVRDMVNFMKQYIKSKFQKHSINIVEEKIKEEIFEHLKVPDTAKNTALALAVQNGHTEVVDLLLEFDERLAGEDFLKDTHIQGASKEGAIKILQAILNVRPSLAKSLPDIIVKAGGQHSLKTWEAMTNTFEQYLQESDILHLAVKQQHLDIVEWLVNHYPSMATREDQSLGKKIALAYNNDRRHYDRDSRVKGVIRSLLVPAIVRSRKPELVQKLLLDADDTPQQVYLDLSIFNTSTHDFEDFMKLVKDDARTNSGLEVNVESASDIKFEAILRYVKFPDLTKSKDHSEDREEVPYVLKWLRRRQVKTVLKLVVPDCQSNPLDEDKILTSVQGLGIEELDWRRLDMGIEPIMDLAPTLSILHLYSSGNWAVLSHWTSEYGLKKLKKLQELHIVIVEDCMSYARTELFVEKTVREFKKLKEKCGWTWDALIRRAPWSELIPLIGSSIATADNGHLDDRSASTCIGLEPFQEKYRSIQQARSDRNDESALKPLKKIKIALIDTGIVAMEDMSMREFQPGQIKDGISFVHMANEESGSHWWLPSDEHGPQMAGIICSIDPYCELYAAKVADGRELNTTQGVIDAIEWAIKQGVDIISMSLVLFIGDEKLITAINRASLHDIVVICSTADKGNNHQKVYPARYQNELSEHCLITIAACDQYGKLTDWSTETEARYRFRGKDVAARPVRFMNDSKTKISGSSVATAIAAGTASLILACSQLALDEKQEVLVRRQRVELFFKKMQKDTELKYVEPSMIFGEEKIDGNLSTYIKETFGKNQNVT